MSRFMASDTLFISEMFASIQGEGLLCGTPSVFVRTSGCHLRCVWCDTPYTSWAAEGQHVSVDEVVAKVVSHAPIKHVVLTGGEPMIAPMMGPLVEQLHAAGYHLTMETAGTHVVDWPVDLWSVSPKLSHSTPTEDARWAARHERLRINLEALEGLVATGRYQLKFVVASADDLAEVETLVRRLQAAPERVLLMPEGRSVAQLDEVASWLVGVCLRSGYRFCDRLHIRLFGNTRGT